MHYIAWEERKLMEYCVERLHVVVEYKCSHHRAAKLLVSKDASKSITKR